MHVTHQTVPVVVWDWRGFREAPIGYMQEMLSRVTQLPLAAQQRLLAHLEKVVAGAPGEVVLASETQLAAERGLARLRRAVRRQEMREPAAGEIGL
jgi:hypothetical protein